MKSIRFTNFLKTNTSGRDNGYIYGIPFSNDRILRGDIPAGRRSFSIKGDIPDPGLLLGEQLADRLRRQGIHVDLVQTARIDYISRYCTRESMPYRIGEILDQRQSRMLSDIIRETNENSNNHLPNIFAYNREKKVIRIFIVTRSRKELMLLINFGSRRV